MKIFNTTQKTPLASNAKIADSFLSRLIGLLDRKKINDGEALIITQCRSIHMFFMRFPIDAIFLDKSKKVVGLVQNIQPFSVSSHFWKADLVIELPAETIKKTQTKLGDLVEWVDA